MVASIVMMAGSVLVPSVLLGAPPGHAADLLAAPPTPATLPTTGAEGTAPIAGSVPATTTAGTYSVTFSVALTKPTKHTPPGLIWFRACKGGTCCDIYIDDDGSFAGIGNCFTFTPLPSDRPVRGLSAAAGAVGAPQTNGSGGNLTFTATNDSVTFYVPNGTLWYAISGPAGYRLVPSGASGVAAVGNLTVSGANVSGTFDLAKGKTYDLKYRETGLIPGTTWCTLFSNCTTAKTTTLKNLTPGTYLYAVAPVAGYSETVTVNGTPAPPFGHDTIIQRTSDILVKFTPNLYATTLNETGLAIGKRMHLTVTCTSTTTNVSGCDRMKASGSVTGSTTNGNITLMLRNGTYAWKITPIKGYTLEVNGIADPTWSGTFSISDSFPKTHNYIGKVTLIK